MTGTYRPDGRTADDLRADLRLAAARRAGPIGGTWADLLFDPNGDWRDAAEPSQALLDVILHAHVDLADHLAEQPGRALDWYLRDVLGLAPLPPIADRVPVTFTADPKALPVVVPGGTALKAGRTPDGRPRVYATDHTLSITGASVGPVHSYHGPGGGARDRTGSWEDRDVPFTPFADGHPPARHELALVTDIADFDGGSMDVLVHFGDGPGIDPARFEGVMWSHSTPDGIRPVVAARMASGGVVLTLDGSHGPCDFEGRSRSFLLASVPSEPLRPEWLAAQVGEVTVAVVERNGVTPSAAFYNDGALDLGREFTPFGPTPSRGDSFYLRCDEAFGKPLDTVSISIAELVDAGPLSRVSPIGDYIDAVLAAVSEDADVTGPVFPLYEQALRVWRPLFPKLSWDRLTVQGWERFASANGIDSIDASVTTTGRPMSQLFELGGQRGRFVRAFLQGGDFGWAAYQRRLAGVVAAAAAGTLSADSLVPPEPPKLSAVSVGYTTAAVRVEEVVVRNGLDRHANPGLVRPFTDDTAAGPLGRLDVHLALPATALGATVSLYFGVAGAAACPRPRAQGGVRWMALGADGAWRPLAVVDGTRGLRQSGVVRLLAPADWAAETGDGLRRLRLETTMPSSAGTISTIVADAVEAAYRFDGDPTTDATPEVPIAPGAITGLVDPVRGVKKATNPAPSVGGRGPEVGYRARAAGVLRHRNRAVQKWDYEQLVLSRFPEVAVACCLPRLRADGVHTVGAVGIVVVPRSDDLAPAPSVDLSERIVAELTAVAPAHAAVDVVCAAYVTVAIEAAIVLRPGVAALSARPSIAAAIDGWLHPLRLAAGGIGRPLFRSTVVALLEAHPDVDRVAHVAFAGRPDDERITVDECRGLIASAGTHRLELEEQL